MLKKMSNKMLSARWVFDSFSWYPSFSELTVAFSSIQSEEKERIGKFVFIKDAKSSLIGRLMMRKFICDASGLPWDKVTLDRDSNGKPCLNNPQFHNLNFNVSHQGRYVVLAGESDSGPLGIDVMEMNYKGGKTLQEFFRLMNRNFAQEEWATITESKDEDDQMKMFYRLWCLKESYVKATGTGITVDLRKIVFKINSKTLKLGDFVYDTSLYLNGNVQKQWEFQETLIDDNHCACVAISCANRISDFKTEPFKFICVDELLDDCKPIISIDNNFCSNFLKKE